MSNRGDAGRVVRHISNIGVAGLATSFVSTSHRLMSASIFVRQMPDGAHDASDDLQSERELFYWPQTIHADRAPMLALRHKNFYRLRTIDAGRHVVGPNRLHRWSILPLLIT
jgi:hypothetical protein